MFIKALTLLDLKFEVTTGCRELVSKTNTEDKKVCPSRSHSSIKYKAKSLLYTVIWLSNCHCQNNNNNNKRNCLFLWTYFDKRLKFLSCMLIWTVCVPTKFSLIFVNNVLALHPTVKILYAVLYYWLTMNSKIMSWIKMTSNWFFITLFI